MTRDELILRTQAAITRLPPRDTRELAAAITHTEDWLGVGADNGDFKITVRYASLSPDTLHGLRVWAGANNLTIVAVVEGSQITFSWEPRSVATATAVR